VQATAVCGVSNPGHANAVISTDRAERTTSLAGIVQDARKGEL